MKSLLALVICLASSKSAFYDDEDSLVFLPDEDDYWYYGDDADYDYDSSHKPTKHKKHDYRRHDEFSRAFTTYRSNHIHPIHRHSLTHLSPYSPYRKALYLSHPRVVRHHGRTLTRSSLEDFNSKLVSCSCKRRKSFWIVKSSGFKDCVRSCAKRAALKTGVQVSEFCAGERYNRRMFPHRHELISRSKIVCHRD